MCYSRIVSHPCRHTSVEHVYCESAGTEDNDAGSSSNDRPGAEQQQQQQQQQQYRMLRRPCAGTILLETAETAEACPLEDCAFLRLGGRWDCCQCGQGRNELGWCVFDKPGYLDRWVYDRWTRKNEYVPACGHGCCDKCTRWCQDDEDDDGLAMFLETPHANSHDGENTECNGLRETPHAALTRETSPFLEGDKLVEQQDYEFVWEREQQGELTMASPQPTYPIGPAAGQPAGAGFVRGFIPYDVFRAMPKAGGHDTKGKKSDYGGQQPGGKQRSFEHHQPGSAAETGGEGDPDVPAAAPIAVSGSIEAAGGYRSIQLDYQANDTETPADEGRAGKKSSERPICKKESKRGRIW